MKLTTQCYIRCEDKVLMLHRIKKKIDINQGKWIGIGGKIEGGESPDECVRREVLEETGLEVTEAIYLFSIPNTYEYSGFLVHTLDQFFLCRIKDDSQIKAMDDVAESFWLPLDQINPDDFGLDSIREGVKLFLKNPRF